MITRLLALIIKEIMTLLRDPKGRMAIILPPVFQLLIFAYAATLDVSHVSLIFYNQDRGKHGAEIVQRFHGAPTFDRISFVNNNETVKKMIDQQKAIAAITIPQDFSRRVEGGAQGKLQVILDGRTSNSAQIVNGYIHNIISDYNDELTKDMNVPTTIIVPRNWFNENLIYLWFTVSSLVGVLAMLIALTITSLSVARERELGTFDQLLVSPLTTNEILIGKTIPAIIIGVLEGSLILSIAILGFGIPFAGSILLAIFVLFIFTFSVVGVGLFVSAISQTQQQALLGSFVFMVPAVSLSGYSTPVENMPEWLQTATNIDPLKHFLITIRGLFLKDMPLMDVWHNTWPLLIIGAVTLSVAAHYFHKRIE